VVQLLFTQTAAIAQIEGRLDSAATVARIEGFEARVGAADNLHLVASVPGGDDRHKAFAAARTLIKQHNDLKGIYADDDIMAQGVAEAVAAAGKDIAVVTTGTRPKTIAAIRNGAITATVSSLPYYTGFWAVESAVRLLQNQAVPAWVVALAQTITAHNVHIFYDPQADVRAGLYR
jgi:ABC-type sugar transport system substrate-binding protein